jgi:hypothetical protein
MIVRHYKGGMYQILNETKKATGNQPTFTIGHIIAWHTEENRWVCAYQYKGEFFTEEEEFVIYESLDGDEKLYARPREMFWEFDYFNSPDVLEPRFEIIEGE